MQQWQEKNPSQQFVPFVMKFRDAATRPLPPPTSASKGKKVRPNIPKTAQKSLRRTKHRKSGEGHKLDQENVKHELFALMCREVTAAWTHGFVHLTQKATVSERNATVTSFHQSSSLCSLLLHFQSRQLQRQRKRMIIMGTITKLV